MWVSVYLLGLLFIYLLWWCADMDFNGTMGRDATVRLRCFLCPPHLQAGLGCHVSVWGVSYGAMGAMGLWRLCISLVLSQRSKQVEMTSLQPFLSCHHFNQFCPILWCFTLLHDPTGHSGWSVQKFCVYSGTVKGRLVWKINSWFSQCCVPCRRL